MARFDELRIAVARVDALASAAEELFDNTMWDGHVDPQRLERAAQLIGMTREAAEQALNAADAANAEECDARPVPAADDEPFAEPNHDVATSARRSPTRRMRSAP